MTVFRLTYRRCVECTPSSHRQGWCAETDGRTFVLKMKPLGQTALAVAVAVLAVSGCGAKTGNTADSAAAAATVLPNDELLAKAAAAVAEASKFDQEFPMPSEPASASGKKIAVMAGGFSAAIHAEMADYMADAVRTSGATLMGPYDGKFTPSTQGGYVDQAVQEAADGIVLFAIDVNTIKAPIEQAIAAGLTVTCAFCYSGGYREKGVVDVTPDFEEQGEVIAWNIIDRTQGKASVLVADEPSQTGVVRRVAGASAVLDQCESCSHEELVIPAADLAQPGPPQFTALLSSRASDFTDVIGYADALAAPMLKTLETSGNSGPAVSSYDAEEAVVQKLTTKSSMSVANMAAPMEFAAWAAVDQAIRGAAGLRPWDSTDLPDVLLTPENVGDYKAILEPQTDWKAEFTELWKS